jgi:hypothetical protein
MSKAVMANPRPSNTEKKFSTLRANIIYQQDLYCTDDRTFVDNNKENKKTRAPKTLQKDYTKEIQSRWC